MGIIELLIRLEDLGVRRIFRADGQVFTLVLGAEWPHEEVARLVVEHKPMLMRFLRSGAQEGLPAGAFKE